MVRGLRDINIAIVGAPKVGKTSSWVRSRARSKFRFRNIFLKLNQALDSVFLNIPDNLDDLLHLILIL